MIISIAAVDLKNGIGKLGKIPWHISKDLQFFKKMSSFKVNSNDEPNLLIMGRKTWESTNYYTFPARNVLLISSSQKFEKSLPAGFSTVSSFEDAKKIIENEKNKRNIIIAGGEAIYNHFWEMSDVILLTKVYKDFDCDRFFPKISKESNFSLFSKQPMEKTDDGINYQVLEWNKGINLLPRNDNNGENQYLNLLKNVLEKGKLRKTRNDETISYFGAQMEFDISSSFPLLTTKRVYWKGVIQELIWFINGETDNKLLKDKSVHIWDGNSTIPFMEKYNHPYEEDICGPIYGWQWRKFNQKYDFKDRLTGETKETRGEDDGFDQLGEVIRLIREDPHSRRIFMSGWNPNQLRNMVLPPCHVSYQFYVDGDELSCHMYQRSGDLFLGVPFNIASTAALTYLLAKITGKKPKRIIISLGDAHIYKGHLDAVKTQLERTPYSFSILEIEDKGEKIEDYTPDDFKIIGYDCHPTIKAEMVA